MPAVRPGHNVPQARPERVLELLSAGRARVVDLRSPVEFAEDHLPGAVNVPLFGDAERALVGTLYKQSSPEAAFRKGRELVAESVEGLVAGIAAAADWAGSADDLAARVLEMTEGGIVQLEGALGAEVVEDLPEDPVFLHCWRGGLRSRSVVALLRWAGLDRALGVAGGYKAYRRQVMEQLDAWQAPPVVVLRGYTGTGKTLVLRAVERLRPGWTVDLEGLAGHRSSILGMVGLEPTSQKVFESGLAARLRAVAEARPGRPLVVEGESRKIGDRVLPVRVWEALVGGWNLLVEARPERRVDVLVADYLEREENRAQLRAQLPFIERRLGPVAWKGRLVEMLDRGLDRDLARLLLEEYYDPLYAHSERKKTYAGRVSMDDPEVAARRVVELVEAQFGAD